MPGAHTQFTVFNGRRPGEFDGVLNMALVKPLGMACLGFLSKITPTHDLFSYSSALVASSSGSVFVCGNSLLTATPLPPIQERSWQTANLRAASATKRAVFFVCRQFFPGLESQIFRLAQQFCLNPMQRNAWKCYKSPTNMLQMFKMFRSQWPRQIETRLFGTCSLRHVASAPSLFASAGFCSARGAHGPGQSVWRLRSVPGRPMSIQAMLWKVREKRRNGERTHPKSERIHKKE